MARMTKVEVVAALEALGLSVDENANYNVLYKQLKEIKAAEKLTGPATPLQVRLVNRQKKKNLFLGDSIRDEKDRDFLNKERCKREYKGRIVRITSIKEYEAAPDGYLETEFIIELKG